MDSLTLPVRASLTVLALFASACSEYEFAEQDLSLRFQPDADRIQLEVDTRGIFATKMNWSESEDLIVTRARDRIQRMAGGERYLHLLSFPLVFDLDEKDPEGPSEEDPWISREDWTRLRGVFLKNVHVTSARAYLDSEGEVGIAQSVRLDEAGACMAALNELISLGVRDSLDGAGPRGDDVSEIFASRASRENLRSFLEAGQAWLALSQQALEVRVPMTPTDLATFTKSLVEDDATGDSAAVGRALFGDLQELRVRDDIVTFRFPVGEDGAIRWSYRGERRPQAKVLAKALAEVMTLKR